MNVYIAAPWFTPEQDVRLQLLKSKLDAIEDISYYSPKDDNLLTSLSDPKVVFETNCDKIRSSDVVVAITDGKDVGTMWECGYAYGVMIPVLYVWFDRLPYQKFNLMLAQSGAVISDVSDLRSSIMFALNMDPNYIGELE